MKPRHGISIHSPKVFGRCKSFSTKVVPLTKFPYRTLFGDVMFPTHTAKLGKLMSYSCWVYSSSTSSSSPNLTMQRCCPLSTSSRPFARSSSLLFCVLLLIQPWFCSTDSSFRSFPPLHCRKGGEGGGQLPWVCLSTDVRNFQVRCSMFYRWEPDFNNLASARQPF
jgi:hypothetical protein